MIKKIVLTGGPCGGKTTSIQKIVENFTELGYKVIVVPEAATLIINMGIKPFGENALSSFEFQKLILSTVSYLESIAMNAAKSSSTDTLIICDRGALDSKAYIDKKGFKKLLKHFDKKELDYMNEYDLVLHLRTAALGKEEFYTLDNNGARTETKEQARVKDNLTLNSWLGHPKLKIIGNESNFDEKQNRVIYEIYNILNKPYPIQRQFKYLVSHIDIDKLLNIKEIVKLELEQYISIINNTELIYRKTIKNNEKSYKIITKIDTNINNERIIKEKMISENEYYLNMPNDTELIKKVRYCFEYKNQYFRLDIFNNGLKILEIEETNKTKKINIPEFIKIDREVTNDIEYRNSSIYRKNKVKKLKQTN